MKSIFFPTPKFLTLLVFILLVHQSINGQIEGIVRDLDTGLPLKNVTVKTKNQVTFTDQKGLFSVFL
jgi:hypothetical protein